MPNKLPGLLLTFILLGNVFAGYAQQVKYYSSDRDLSNSMVTNILQDGQGFIWIATEDGLNRFDGLRFNTYRNIRDDPFSLTSNFVRTLFVDSQHRLWVGTINSLMLYNSDQESFREVELYRDTLRLRPHVTSIIESATGDILVGTSGHGLVIIRKGMKKGYTDMNLILRLNSEFLECVYEDSRGRFWIGTENEGLNLYDPFTDEVKAFRHQPGNPKSISSNYITAITEDERKNILVGTLNGGLNQYLEFDNTFGLIPVSSDSESWLPVKTLFADERKNIWVGTDGQGLWKMNSGQGILEQQVNIASTRFDVSKTKIHAITEDHEGNLWLGIFHKGVVLVPGNSHMFNALAYQWFGDKGMVSGCIMAIAEDHLGQVWMGTDAGGLYKVNSQTGQVKDHQLHTGVPKKPAETITSICVDGSNNLWMGTTLEGFIRLDPKTGSSTNYRHQSLNDNSLSNDKVQCITLDESDNLWIGTSGGGISIFNPRTGQFSHLLHDKNNTNSVCNDWINTIFCDREGLVWIGTYNRLSVYNPVTRSFSMMSVANGLLPNNIVFCITEDSQGRIWIGTNEGIACFDKKINRSTFFTTADGMSNNVICSILEDDNKQLWISTHLGISRFSPADSSFRNYYEYDGLPGNEFRRNSGCKLANGEILFGGINGAAWFKPEQIVSDKRIPEVYLTDLILFNKPVLIGEKLGGRVILEKSIEKTDTLILSWQQKNFSIEFSTIGFSNPERISYQFRLTGFDHNWISTGAGNRRATYTNLEPGKYLFEVRATDKENYSTIRQLKVRLIPPWWVQWWMRGIYLFITLSLVYWIYIYLKSRIRHRQELLHLEHQEKINEAKLQFFTNISHEIRTPLTLIAGPLEKLMAENKDRSLSKSYQLMSQNTHRLMRLVNQLLDIRKIDRGQILINYARVDLVRFIREIMNAFEHLSEKKHISFSYTPGVEELMVWIDPNNFDKVLYNVLSNAFKFTPIGGSIDIQLKTGLHAIDRTNPADYAEITVSDTGPGIEEDKLNRIFDRFYQIDPQQDENPGTGIGLHLSRTLVEMQHGEIFAMNRTDQQGSIFVIRIPLGQDHTKDETIAAPSASMYPTNEPPKWLGFEDVPDETGDGAVPVAKPVKRPRFKIVIADDDGQLRHYLKEELSSYFQIIECSNGKEALDSVHLCKPDLVVSDVMMPVMDGIMLCRKLKTDPQTSHLPVVLLTALTDDVDRTHGLETGADAYLEKPFKAGLLKTNINNLLENRERIKIRYSPGGNINAENRNYTSSDKALIDKILQIIELHLADPAFGAEALSREVGMSRVHLFRRMKKITGQPASEFIRKIRLQKAAQLLKANNGSIKEIAFETGFASLSNFSRTFHEFYGIKPSEFSKVTIEEE